MRPDYDHYFMDIARAVATRATCARKHVGAVIVSRDRHMIATGYNGSIRGTEHCDDAGHLMEADHCIRTIHAESNAILQAARRGAAVDGATLYVTASPCWPCFGLVVNAGIVRVVFGEAYRAEDPGPKRVVEVARQVGVELVALATATEVCPGVQVEHPVDMAVEMSPATVSTVFHRAWSACVGASQYDKRVWLDAQGTMDTAGARDRGARDYLLRRVREIVESQGVAYDPVWEYGGALSVTRAGPPAVVYVTAPVRPFGNCDECKDRAAYECTCPRCEHEGADVLERFYACIPHRQAVAGKHFRIRGRDAVWVSR